MLAYGRPLRANFIPQRSEEVMMHIENISETTPEFSGTRRGFLKGMLGAGAFVLSVRWMPEQLFAASASVNPADAMGKAVLHPGVYLAIDKDGTAYVVAHRSEMGNGVRTSLPRIVAEELDADWARVKVVQATGDEKYGDQDTDGSHSVRSFFDTLRETGAAARLVLVREGAQAWGGTVSVWYMGLDEVGLEKVGTKI